jgi:HK97 family phage major capsid protein
MKLKDQHAAALKAAKDIVDAARKAGRTSLTESERQQVDAHLAKADELRPLIEKAEEDSAIFRRLEDGFGSRGSKHQRFDARNAVVKAVGDFVSRKAIATGTNEVAPAGLVVAEPIPLGRVAQDLLSVIPTEALEVPPTFAYVRQTMRTNNAAAVAAGGTKPTSVYNTQRIEDRLRVIAHMSEPIDKYWLEDLPGLRTFVGDELGFGLNVAVENQVLNGDGVGENMTGMLAVSGIQTQAFSTDMFETLRKALTKVQLLGGRDVVIALHPTDWEAMDLVRVGTTNQFLVGSTVRQSVTGGEVSAPTGSSALLSWGIPVVLSNAVPVGTGVVFDRSAVGLRTDRAIELAWDASTGFSKNQLFARCEGRFGLIIRNPSLIVEADLTAA